MLCAGALLSASSVFAQAQKPPPAHKGAGRLSAQERAGLRGDVDRISRDIYRQPPPGRPRR